MNGWEGFLSRISQDNRMEFFMAAFTLKLVAKTKMQEYIKHITISSNLVDLLFWIKNNDLTCALFSSLKLTSVPDNTASVTGPRLLPCLRKRMFGLRLQWQDNEKGRLGCCMSTCVPMCNLVCGHDLWGCYILHNGHRLLGCESYLGPAAAS